MTTPSMPANFLRTAALLAAATCAAQPATYYLDSAAGNDAFSGRSSEQAWRS